MPDVEHAGQELWGDRVDELPLQHWVIRTVAIAG
jgi:hypothetical protein